MLTPVEERRLRIGCSVLLIGGLVSGFFWLRQMLLSTITVRNDGTDEITEIVIWSQAVNQTIQSLKPGESITLTISYDFEDSLRIVRYRCPGHAICGEQFDIDFESRGAAYDLMITLSCEECQPRPKVRAGEGVKDR